MAVEGKLTGWLQLIDSSFLKEDETNGVFKFFSDYRSADPACEKEEVLFSMSGAIIPFSITFWDDWPPDIEKDFERLVPALEDPASFLLFSWSTRCPYTTEPLKFIMVTKKKIYTIVGSEFFDPVVTKFKLTGSPTGRR